MQTFGERIKELRQNAGLTQQQLADRIWVSKAAISNYELYERNPSPEILVKLAKVFHVSVDYLLGIEEKSQTLDLSGLTDEDVQVLENGKRIWRKHTDGLTNRNHNASMSMIDFRADLSGGSLCIRRICMITGTLHHIRGLY